MQRTLFTIALVGLFVLPGLASAQTRSRQIEAPTVAGETFDTFANEVRAGVQAEGGEAPSDEQLREVFTSLDTDGNGALDEREIAASNQNPQSCNGGGICRHGRCFCSGGLEHTTPINNPLVVEPTHMNNVIHQ
ncbi:MAG: hypothetical protein KC561_08905 [Myxococcales bacterium]|nr:hypothetical protein [Myxococcales bacterium]